MDNEKYDPVCPGCGRLMSEHEEDLGTTFTRLYDELHATMTQELGIPTEQAHPTLRKVLDAVLYMEGIPALVIANPETGMHFWLRRDGRAIQKSGVMDTPTWLMPVLQEALKAQEKLVAQVQPPVHEKPRHKTLEEAIRVTKSILGKAPLN